MKKNLPYIVIGVLLTIMFFQWKSGCKESVLLPPVEVVKVDTLYDTTYIHDTVPGEPEWVYHHYDTTIWVMEPDNVPASTYDSLLTQYIELGNLLYSTNAYKTRFPIDTFGYVTVFDTIWSNQLISNSLVSDLRIPEKTIYVEKLIYRPKEQEMYLGLGLMSNSVQVVSGVNVGMLYKDRKDRMYQATMGYFAGQPMLGLSFYKRF
jgi:hypothetical protein